MIRQNKKQRYKIVNLKGRVIETFYYKFTAMEFLKELKIHKRDRLDDLKIIKIEDDKKKEI